MLIFRCCNAALGAPGPIPSGPFPHQNPKSRDADRAGFVRGSLQQDLMQLPKQQTNKSWFAEIAK